MHYYQRMISLLSVHFFISQYKNRKTFKAIYFPSPSAALQHKQIYCKTYNTTLNTFYYILMPSLS